MAYSGNLVSLSGPNARRLPHPNPAHGEDVPYAYAEKFQAPPGADYGTGFDYTPVVMVGGGIVLDTPDSRDHGGHGAGGDFRSYETDTAYQHGRALGTHSGTDRGYVRSNYYPPEFQFSTESYHSEFLQGNPSPAPNHVVLLRGINSNPENNPEVEGYDPGGFRRGFDRLRWIWRERPINQQRNYTAQQVTERNIQTIGNSPAPEEAPYWQPFADSLSRGYTRMNMVSALPRDPVDMSEAVESVTSDTIPAQGDVSWIGVTF